MLILIQIGPRAVAVAGGIHVIPVFRRIAAGAGVDIIALFRAGRRNRSGKLIVVTEGGGRRGICMTAGLAGTAVRAAFQTGGGIFTPIAVITAHCAAVLVTAVDALEAVRAVVVVAHSAGVAVRLLRDHRRGLRDLRCACGVAEILLTTGAVPVFRIARSKTGRGVGSKVLQVRVVCSVLAEIFCLCLRGQLIIGKRRGVGSDSVGRTGRRCCHSACNRCGCRRGMTAVTRARNRRRASGVTRPAVCRMGVVPIMVEGGDRLRRNRCFRCTVRIAEHLVAAAAGPVSVVAGGRTSCRNRRMRRHIMTEGCDRLTHALVTDGADVVSLTRRCAGCWRILDPSAEVVRCLGNFYVAADRANLFVRCIRGDPLQVIIMDRAGVGRLYCFCLRAGGNVCIAIPGPTCKRIVFRRIICLCRVARRGRRTAVINRLRCF